MEVLFYVAIAIFLRYIIFIWTQYGVLSSISESYYRLPQELKILFTIFCWGFAIPVMIMGSSVLTFLAGSAICFVGAAAAFKEKLTSTVHEIGAYVGVILAQVALVVDMQLWWLSAIFFVTSLFLTIWKNKVKHPIWWIELTAFTTTLIGLGIKVL